MKPNVPHYIKVEEEIGVAPKDIVGGYSYNVGTAMAYLLRSPYKHEESPMEDIAKARDHLNFELERLHGQAQNRQRSDYQADTLEQE